MEITTFRQLSRSALLTTVIIGTVLMAGCARMEKEAFPKYRETRVLMGTEVQIDVCEGRYAQEKIDQAFKAAWARLGDISWRMNVLDERSDVHKINQSGMQPVTVGADTYKVLKDAQQFSRMTDGAFDITVWPLMQLWRDSEINDTFATPEQIRKVQSSVGSDLIQLLPDDRVQLLHPQTKIDLGGIAKGYAVDEAARILREHGITDFYIDAGGDLYVGGKNCQNEPWRIGIRDPRDRSRVIEVVLVSDMAVVTSGNYEQHYMIKGQRWSHIINPVTGYPQKGVVSATVVAPSAEGADALATALCVLGGPLGKQHIDRLDSPYASLIFSSNGPGSVERFESQEFKIFQYKK